MPAGPAAPQPARGGALPASGVPAVPAGAFDVHTVHLQTRNYFTRTCKVITIEVLFLTQIKLPGCK